MDPVVRRLRLLDEHVRERESLFLNFIEKSPLLFAALGMICGIFIASRINIGVWAWLLLISPIR